MCCFQQLIFIRHAPSTSWQRFDSCELEFLQLNCHKMPTLEFPMRHRIAQDEFYGLLMRNNLTSKICPSALFAFLVAVESVASTPADGWWVMMHLNKVKFHLHISGIEASIFRNFVVDELFELVQIQSGCLQHSCVCVPPALQKRMLIVTNVGIYNVRANTVQRRIPIALISKVCPPTREPWDPARLCMKQG